MGVLHLVVPLLLVGSASTLLVHDPERFSRLLTQTNDLRNDIEVHRQLLTNLESLVGLVAKFVPNILPVLEGSVSFLDSHDIAFINEILEIDGYNHGFLNDYSLVSSLAAAGNDMASSKNQTAVDNFDPLLVPLLGLMAPVWGSNVSPSCKSFSKELVKAFFANPMNSTLAKMLDFSGKIPDGIAQNMLPLGTPPFAFYAPIGNTAALGAFDSCLDLGRNTLPGTQYVLAKLVYNNGTDCQAPKESSMHLQSLEGVSKPIPHSTLDVLCTLGIINLSWGLCAPSDCTPQEILDFPNALLNRTLGPLYPDNATALLFEPHSNDKVTKESLLMNFTSGTIVYLTILSIIGAFVVAGTLTDLYRSAKPVTTLVEGEPELSTLTKVLLCFSINTNARKLVNSDAGPSDDHLGCLNGIRTISILWVILGHMYFIFEIYGVFAGNVVQNKGYLFSVAGGREGVKMETVLNAFFSVDTFFLMGAVLVAYLTFIQLEKKKFNIVVFFVHRYLRLTIPYALVIGFAATLAPWMGSGPNFSAYKETCQACSNNWWVNMLYVNNFVNLDQLCLGVTWYLANDMQFYIYSPIIILPLWWKESVGLVWWFINLVVFTAIPTWLASHYHSAPTGIGGPGGTLDGFNTNNDFYIKPYARFQPYLVGLLLGYVLFKLRGKKVHIPQGLNVFLWLLSVAFGMFLVMIFYPMRVNEGKVTWFELVIYNGLSRLGWSLPLSWVIFACCKGYGGPVNSFLSWGAFTGLARVTYMVYLIHLDILAMFVLTRTYTLQISVLLVTVYFMALSVLTFAISFVFCLCLESPFIRLEKMAMTAIFGGGGNRKKKQQSVENTAAAAKPNDSMAETDQQRQPSDKSSKEKLETPQEIKKTTAFEVELSSQEGLEDVDEILPADNPKENPVDAPSPTT